MITVTIADEHDELHQVTVGVHYVFRIERGGKDKRFNSHITMTSGHVWHCVETIEELLMSRS